jgi:hypothetical protein
MDRLPQTHWIRTALAIGAALVILAGLVFFSRDRGQQPTGGFDFTDPAMNVPTLTGSVLDVQNDSFTLDVPQILGTPVPERLPLRTRVVHVGANTVISGRSERTANEYEAALKQYVAAKARGARAIPPHTYAELALTIRDLRTGDVVRVSELGFPDIKAKPEILATAITRL